VAAQILKGLGLLDVRLLSNNPRKGCALRSFGITVREELPLVVAANPHNRAYLEAKRAKLGHRIPQIDGGLRILAGRE
jgi:3,4-dihydroxy 2-butanone 4-phosphate synthase/GTP cyclohydrolase II